MSEYQKRRALSELIETTIRDCYPDEWFSEDVISAAWLKTLRAEYGRKQLSWPSGVSVVFDCHKLTKKNGLEQRHGDIGFLVKITHSSRGSIVGLGSLEAKRSYPNQPHDKYPALDLDQLERQFAHSSVQRLLLYSHEPLSHLGGNHAAVLPASTAILCSADISALDSIGKSLSDQILRYLQGWDLDFSRTTVDSVLTGESRYSYLLRAHVGLERGIKLDLNDLKMAGSSYVDIDSPDIDSDFGLGGPDMPLPKPPGRDMGGFEP